MRLSKPEIVAIGGIALNFVAATFYFMARDNKCGIQLLDGANLVPVSAVLVIMLIGYFLVVLSESRDIQVARKSHGQSGIRGKINSSRSLQYFLSATGNLGIWLTAYALYSDSLSNCQGAL